MSVSVWGAVVTLNAEPTGAGVPVVKTTVYVCGPTTRSCTSRSSLDVGSLARLPSESPRNARVK